MLEDCNETRYENFYWQSPSPEEIMGTCDGKSVGNYDWIVIPSDDEKMFGRTEGKVVCTYKNKFFYYLCMYIEVEVGSNFQFSILNLCNILEM